jgi:serine/threonine-protein kinase
MSLTLKRLALLAAPLAAAGLLACGALPVVQGQDGGPRRQEVANRANDVLKQHCLKCHGDDKSEDFSKFSFFDRPTLEKRKIIVPGKPEESKLIVRVTTTENRKRMPPVSEEKEPLAGADVEVLKDWIAAGAPSFSDKVVKQPPAELNNAPPPPPDSVGAQVRTLFVENCVQCHGESKPKGGFQITDRAQVLDKSRVVPSDPAKSELLTRLVDKDMPPPGEGRKPLTDAQIEMVRAWIKAGAPEATAPEERLVKGTSNQVGDEYVLRSILNDVRKLAGQNERLGSYRYFSLNHLLTGGVTPRDLEFNTQALTLVVNHLSRKAEFAVPEPIEPTRTVFRVDISKLGWDRQRFVTQQGQQPVAADLTLFDLVLLDYPYGMIYDGSEAYAQLVTDYLNPIRQVRPVAFVRADWFVNTASRPPLYEDLLQLPATFQALQKQLDVDVEDNLKNLRLRRAGVSVSGVSRNNRIVEHHEPNGSAYLWVSYDYKTNKGPENMFQDPVHLNPAGGEMIFALPNGLQGYYVATGKGARLDAAPTEIVTDPDASDQAVRNGLACMRCHFAGMKTFTDDVRPVLEQLTGSLQAFDRRDALRLYPPQTEMARLVKRDAGRFNDAVKRLFDGRPPDIHQVLKRVSYQFLDERINLPAAAEELGEAAPEKIARTFQSRQLAAVGLMQLASGGAVRRDTWEDFYDQVAEQFGRGVPVIPVDGITRTEYERPDGRVTFEVKMNRTRLKEGDRLVIFVKNTSAVPVFVEAFLNGTQGQKAMLTKDGPSQVAAGGTVRFPPEEGKGIKISATAGKEQVIVYACENRFEKGEVLMLPEADEDKGLGMADRVVHRQFYRLPAGGLRPTFDVSKMVKKTVEIETQ